MTDMTKAIEEVLQAAEEAAKNTLDRAGKLGVKQAQETALFKHGNDFENEIVFNKESDLSGEVVSGAKYSEYLEYGNDPGGGIIRPVNAKVLHFFANGEEVFAKSVKAHEPFPFMANAQEVVENEIENIFAEELDKLLR